MRPLAKAMLAGGGAMVAALLFGSPTRRGKGGGVVLHAETTPSGSGLSFARELPENPGPAREAMILEAVRSGQAMVRWSFVTSEHAGHSATIPVLARALQIGAPGEAWRVICDYRTCQAIADHLSCVMLTPFVADKIFLQSDVQLKPLTRPWSQDGTMAKTFRSVEQSLALDGLVPLDDAGLVANEGKQWVNAARIYAPLGFSGWDKPAGALGSKHNGPNYGWHQPGSGKPIQSVGLAHDMAHSDYSQMVQLMSRVIVVDGVEKDVADVLRDPELWPLVSNEGPLPSAVHPDLVGSV